MGGVRDPCSIANDRTLYSKASVVKGQMPGHEAPAKPSSRVPEGLSQQVFTWGWGNSQCFNATTAKHLTKYCSWAAAVSCSFSREVKTTPIKHGDQHARGKAPSALRPR